MDPAANDDLIAAYYIMQVVQEEIALIQEEDIIQSDIEEDEILNDYENNINDDDSEDNIQINEIGGAPNDDAEVENQLADAFALEERESDDDIEFSDVNNRENEEGNAENSDEGDDITTNSSGDSSENDSNNSEHESNNSDNESDIDSDGVTIGSGEEDVFSTNEQALNTEMVHSHTASNVETAEIINLSVQSELSDIVQPKKRRRESVDDNTSQVRDTTTEDDGSMCPICLESWELTGPHRLVSLRCGHLFGESCILRWLQASYRQNNVRSCSTCKAVVKSKDIRHIYAKRIQVVDRSAENDLNKKLEIEQNKVDKLEFELDAAKVCHAFLNNQVQELRNEIHRLKVSTNKIGKLGAPPKLEKLTLRMSLERSIDLPRDSSCRYMLYSAVHGCLLISQKSPLAIFNGFGISFISGPNFQNRSFMFTSTKSIKDLSLSYDENLVVVVSQEHQAKIYDMVSHQHISTLCANEMLLWSCCMGGSDNRNLLYLGSQNGKIYIFNVDVPTQIIKEYATSDDTSPVIVIKEIPKSVTFPSGGIIACKLTSIWVFNESAIGTRLHLHGPFTSISFDTEQFTLLASTRNSASHQCSRYIYGSLETIMSTPIFVKKYLFDSSKSSPVMTRCIQFMVKQKKYLCGYAQDAKLLNIYDADVGRLIHSVYIESIVYDLCCLNREGGVYLCALSENKCRMYKFLE